MGTTPYVMTFDDGGESQMAFGPDGSIGPDTAVGIMLEFAKSHPGYEPAATFYVNGDSFLAGAERLRDREPHARSHQPGHRVG